MHIDKIERKILVFMKKELITKNECIKNSDISSSTNIEINKVITKTHLLETRELLKLVSYSPQNHKTYCYKITGSGIDSLKVNYRMIVIEIAILIAAIASVAGLFL